MPRQQSASVAGVAAPDIPFNPEDAFYPLRRNASGKIVPTFYWRECTKRFIWCTKWEKIKKEYPDLEWFYMQGFGLTKLKGPK